jgi:hypothetical protein
VSLRFNIITSMRQVQLMTNGRNNFVRKESFIRSNVGGGQAVGPILRNVRD